MIDQGLEAAISAAGSVTALAGALKITKQSVSAWKRIPAERVLEVEQATGVDREILRPDIYAAPKFKGKWRLVAKTKGKR